MAYLLAIDAGTGSCRAVLFTDEGREVAAAGREWHAATDPRYPGSQPMDTHECWELIADSIGEAFSIADVSPADVDAVCAASARGGIVVLDEDRRDIWACGATDSRAAVEIRTAREQDPDLEIRNYRVTGQTLSMSAAPRLRWIEEHLPSVFDRAASVEMWSDWVLTKLSGEVVSGASNACTNGFVGLASRSWMPDLLQPWGLPESLLPPIVEAGVAVGSVTAAAAERTGLAAGTPVVMGGGDTQLAAVGLGVVHAGQTAIVGGSFWQQLVNIDRPATDPDMRVRVNCHAVRGIWQAETLVFGAGLSVRWFRDAFCIDLFREAGGRAQAYALLDEAARSVAPGSDGCLAILSNSMDYGRWRHASPSLLGLPLTDPSRSRAIVHRAILEAAAFAAAENLASITRFCGTDSSDVVVGGGVTRSTLWCQILADVLDREVLVPTTAESTALGTAICAGVGVGAFAGLAEAAGDLVTWERIHHPEPEAVEAYREAAGRWRAAYDQQLPLAASGITSPMWTAPGEGRGPHIQEPGSPIEEE